MPAARATRLLPVPDFVNGPGNPVRSLWDRVHQLPGGRALFSRLIGRMAPYTGTIKARVVDLRAGYSEVRMRDRRAVRNHLHCIHAIALVNLAEVCGNVAIAYSMPDDARFIVAGLSIDYLKKARGTITAKCESPVPETAERTEFAVLVHLHDASGEVVAKATLRTLVGPKKRRDA